MTGRFIQRLLYLAAAMLGVWLAARYVLPSAVPFVLGALLALGAEPGVRLLERRCHWPRLAAAGLCVSLTILLVMGLVSVIGALTVRELSRVAKMAPEMGRTVENGLAVLQDWLLTAADGAPERLRPVLIQTVLGTFQDSSRLVDQATARIPGLIGELVGTVSQGALTVGTGVLAGFLISARLDKLSTWLSAHLPPRWRNGVLPGLRRVKKTFGRWLLAQLKLMAVTWGIVGLGFGLMGVPNGLMWAALVALVDAVPVLGTGTVLVPWAIVRFLQADRLGGFSLLIIFGVSWLARSILEPRIVGKSLGIDPLVSLGAFYAGFRLWGVPGMICGPVLTALGKGLWESSRQENS